jgi:hypothetical protein
VDAANRNAPADRYGDEYSDHRSNEHDGTDQYRRADIYAGANSNARSDRDAGSPVCARHVGADHRKWAELARCAKHKFDNRWKCPRR